VIGTAARVSWDGFDRGEKVLVSRTHPEGTSAVSVDEAHRRRLRFALPFAAAWLIVLLGPGGDVVDRTDGAATVAGIALLVLFAVTYLLVVVASWDPAGRRRARQLTVLLMGVALAVLPWAGQSGLITFVFVAVCVQLVLPWTWAVAASAGLVVLDLAIGRAAGWSDAGSFAFSIVAAAMAMFGIARMSERNRALVSAHDERASYAVLAERERFARDLHDILGHGLTVIAVKSELAGKLVDLDPAKARAEIADVERLAREALADVRSTVGNYREVSLAAEIASARKALDAAGIEPDLPTAVDEVPGPLREVFGYVVREGVTNVVRHSGADRCTVRLARDAVEVLDNGPSALPGSWRSGNGLDGLRHRAALAGCVLEAGPRDGGGFRLAAVTAP
jgi:two-component system sensor histidine kinase DesK